MYSHLVDMCDQTPAQHLSALFALGEYRGEGTEKIKRIILIGKPLVSGCLKTERDEV